MLVIGLTGGIASGKSTVSRLLKDRYRLTVIDLDILAREVVEPGQPAYNDIVRDFGYQVLIDLDGGDAGGRVSSDRIASSDQAQNGPARKRPIDRKKLGAVVFNDKAKLKRLNRYTHPRIYQRALWLILVAWFRGDKIVYLDVPLLIETGMWKRVGNVLLVYTSENIQFQRLLARDEKGEEDAKSRLRNQMSLDQKIPFADHILNNSGDEASLEEQVHDYLGDLAVRYSDLHPSQKRNSSNLPKMYGSSSEGQDRTHQPPPLKGLIGGFEGLRYSFNAHGLFRLWFWLWLVEWLFPPAGIMAAGISILCRTLFRSPQAIRASRRLRDERERAAASVHYHQKLSSDQMHQRRSRKESQH